MILAGKWQFFQSFDGFPHSQFQIEIDEQGCILVDQGKGIGKVFFGVVQVSGQDIYMEIAQFGSSKADDSPAAKNNIPPGITRYQGTSSLSSTMCGNMVGANLKCPSGSTIVGNWHAARIEW